jgi:serine/threonine-protein kinase
VDVAQQQEIGGYAVKRRLIQTASSEVFVAYDARRRQDVVLKMVLPQFARDKKVLGHYAREAEISADLEHPNLVKVHEFVTHVPRPYLVMNFISGQTLKRAIYRGGELVYEKGFSWLVNAARGLAFMHQHGWVHMDVKPENLLVDDPGNATVIDLAMARMIGPRSFMDNLKWRFRGQTFGTRSYMAPEQIENKPLGPAADIYSFGIVMFETFARRLPLTASDPDAILQLHLKAKPPMLHHVMRDINPGLSQLVARMLEKDPQGRPHSMDMVIDALAKIGKPQEGRSGAKAGSVS